MHAKDGAHEVREWVVPKVRRHICHAEPLALLEGRAWGVGQGRHSQGLGSFQAVARVLLGDGEGEVRGEGVGHGVERLH
jgi:hypothetical protein